MLPGSTGPDTHQTPEQNPEVPNNGVNMHQGPPNAFIPQGLPPNALRFQNPHAANNGVLFQVPSNAFVPQNLPPNALMSQNPQVGNNRPVLFMHHTNPFIPQYDNNRPNNLQGLAYGGINQLPSFDEVFMNQIPASAIDRVPKQIDLNNKLTHFSRSTTDLFLERAKSKKDTYSVDDNWCKFIGKISSSNPKTFWLMMIGVLPAAAQLLELFWPTYYIKGCSEGLYSNQLPINQCYEKNNDSVTFVPDMLCSSGLYSTLMTWATSAFGILLFMVYKYWTEFKYMVKLLIIRTVVALPFDYMWCVYLVIAFYLGILSLLRISADSWRCTVYGSGGIDSNIDFEISLSSGNVYVATGQLLMLYSCLITTLIKHSQDPYLAYSKLKTFVDEAQSLNYDFSRIDYEITTKWVIHFCEAYYKNYKTIEEEKWILLGMLEHLFHIGEARKTIKEE